MEATVNLGSHQIPLKAELKILGLWIDGKPRWGPTYQESPSKNGFSQTMALTKGCYFHLGSDIKIKLGRFTVLSCVQP